MGEQNLAEDLGSQNLRSFTRAVLDDVKALERMLDEGMIESGERRIGAEQEMFVVDAGYGPSRRGHELVGALGDERFTSELGRFNLEANLTPHRFGGGCLRALEQETDECLSLARDAARAQGDDIVLCGILPTLAKPHLDLDWMTPKPRYYALNKTMVDLSGGAFKTDIAGLDHLQMSHDNIMLEACNTSFQVHFQVSPDEFPRLYNLAQAVTGPVLAAAVNSPLLLKRRLWHETRVALFQQSVDARSSTHQARGQPARVSFGERWVDDSVLEIFRQDIARFRVVLATDLGVPSTEMLDRGEIPPLKALCLHNGTVYRWNRACYGVKDGVAHLRIENRVLPAGPTVLDEVANSAFFFGLMSALGEEHDDVTDMLEFDHARGNFLAAARDGLQARFHWLHGEVRDAGDLILNHLLPLARDGLAAARIDKDDIDRYLNVIEHRVDKGRTGAQWMLSSLADMGSNGTKEERFRAVTKAMAVRQAEGHPVHTWDLAYLAQAKDWKESYRVVGQVMKPELFTLHPEDVVDLAASLMDWERIRHIPVEDNDGRLVGIVSHRSLLRILSRGLGTAGQALAVREIMRPAPITVTRQTSSIEAIRLMKANGVGCLPVVEHDKLVGIVTEGDFLEVASILLEEALGPASSD